MTKTYYLVESLIVGVETRDKSLVKILYYVFLIMPLIVIPIILYFKLNETIIPILIGASIGLTIGMKQKIDLKEQTVIKEGFKNYSLLIGDESLLPNKNTEIELFKRSLDEVGVTNKQIIERLIQEIDEKNNLIGINIKVILDTLKGISSTFIIAPIAFVLGLLSTDLIKSLNVGQQISDNPLLFMSIVKLILIIVIMVLLYLFIIIAIIYSLIPFIKYNILSNRTKRNKVKNYLLDVLYQYYLE